MKIYVTGVSGTGKSSVARALTAKGIMSVDIDEGLSKWIHKDTGQAAEWKPGMSDEWYAVYGWRCDVKKLRQLLAENKDIVVVGAAVNQDEYLSFFDKIYFLYGTPETIIPRIEGRNDNEYGKHPIEQAKLLTWQETYAEEMKERGAIQINVERPLEDIVETISSNFASWT